MAIIAPPGPIGLTDRANNNQGLLTTLLEVFRTKIDFISIIYVYGIAYWEY